MRDTLSILSYALALSPSLSIAVSRSLSPASSGIEYFLTYLGGASLDVKQNYWGTTDIATITALMQVPAVTDFTLISQNDNQCPTVGRASPINAVTAAMETVRGKRIRSKYL